MSAGPRSPVVRAVAPGESPSNVRSPIILASLAEAGPSSARLSPIIAKNMHVPTPSHPEFAELLTPAKLRKKRRHEPLVSVPAGLPAFRAGVYDGGYYTPDGDFFRGATADPTATAVPIMAQLEEDAVTIGGSSSSSSSSGWSWTSDLERGRRATMAVFGRVGEALRGRRGSDSTASSDDSSVHELRSQVSGAGPRRRRMSRLSRTISRAKQDDDVPAEKPRREYLPRKRQFTLLVPPEDGAYTEPILTPSANPRDSSSTGGDSLPVSQRVISTPSLPDVLDRIRRLRLAAGILAEPVHPHHPLPGERRARSGPGHRRPKARGLHSFMAPPVPQRPIPSRAGTRVQELRGTAFADAPIRPKSASDLLGLVNASSNNSSLADLPKADSSDSLKSLPAASTLSAPDQKGCWWLDVSCPTWEDLRDIGELLALHPLTLEDVLQQDPREKLDLFERLGYYFVVIRALDEGYFKYTPGTGSAGPTVSGLANSPKIPPDTTPELDPHDPEKKKEGRRRGWGMGRAVGKTAQKVGEKVEIVEDNPGREGLEGVGVGGVNVYLVVFADGIVSFHYEDISKHTKRVLDRILTQAGGDHSSDWVAHGLLDSIVDAFFPLIRYVDGEIDDIDSLTIDPTHDPKSGRPPSPVPNASEEKLTISSSDESIGLSGDGAAEYIPLNYLEEKRSRELERTKSAVMPKYGLFPRIDLPGKFAKLAHLFTLPPDKRVNMHMNLPRPFAYPFIYLGLFFLPITDAVKPKHHSVNQIVVDRSMMLRRMTDMRRLVSGLTRLLGAKHQVVARMRKRIAEKNRNVDAYIGDVEDHILLLQNSLYHYEYILAHCQPAFLSHLSVSFSFARGGTDKAILALSTVSISILPMMLLIGLFSMNVSIPHNGASLDKPHAEEDGSISPFNYFAGIVVGAFLIACIMISVIRYWRYAARRKWSRIRGESMPPFWQAYWGWQ